MSDALKALWKSMEEGWKAGASVPALPTPSVGRGWFDSPFLSERDRDVRDLRALYERVRAAHSASVFADEEAHTRAVHKIFRAALDRTSADPSWMLAVGYEPVQRLLEEEFLAFPNIDEGTWPHLTLVAQSELRSFLLRKDVQLAREEQVFELAKDTCIILLVRLCNGALTNAISGELDALSFDGAALDLASDPAEDIEFCWRFFFHEDLKGARLFEGVRSTLERNALVACRVAPGDPNAWTTKVYLPTKAKGRTPRELVTEYLGDTPLAEFFEAQAPVEIPTEVRFEHTHVLAGSGHGKSQLLLHLIHHDLAKERGPGVIVIDSQGDLVRTISRLELFAPGGGLAERLVLVDPADVEYPIALSLFDVPEERFARYTPADRERLLNGAIEMYEYVFSSLLGAELTQKQGVIFRFLARLLMVVPGATLQTFLDLMEHGERFRPYMQKLDGTARRFFEDEFFHPSFAATKKQIAKRLWGILANPTFERMFSQPKGKLDLFDAMQARKIVLISTAKDVLRQEGAEILGRFFLAKITQAVMERAVLTEPNREGCFLYIDEAQEYVDEQMALLLNQARKYRVGLTLAHQNLDQLPTALRASVMSSTSVKLAGGVSAKDARAMADEMQVGSDFLQSVRKRRDRSQFACHIRNRTPRAITISVPLGTVNALPQLSDAELTTLIERNRATYCVPAQLIDRLPAAYPTLEFEPVSAPAAPSGAPPRAAPNADPYVAGRGGHDHKYLQHLLRTAAQERGLKAELEVPLPNGSVDVAVEGSGWRIACEISVTTDAEDDAKNVGKCLAAGFDEVWVVVSSQRRKSARAKALSERLGSAPVRVFLAADALAALDERAASMNTQTTQVRGYAITVRSAPVDAEEAKRRRAAIAAILAKRPRDERR